MGWPEWITIVIAASSAVVACLAWLAARSSNAIAGDGNKIALNAQNIAKRAQEYSEQQPTERAWDDLLVAVAKLQTFDPNGDEDARPLMTEVRTRATLLIDRLHWEGFDKWIAAESQHGALLMREAMHRASVAGAGGGSLTIDQHVEFAAMPHAWVAALTSNLRLLRRKGWDSSSADELRRKAVDGASKVAAQYGWDPPPDSAPGVTYL